MEKYKAFLDEVAKNIGLSAFRSDESGLVSVRVDDAYNVNLQYVEATGKVLCFIEMAQLPSDASKVVYRDLLAAGLFGKETAGGYFALEPETETVVYNYTFDLGKASADIDEFVSALEKILQLCDLWSERIMSDINGGAKSGSSSAHEEHELIRV